MLYSRLARDARKDPYDLLPGRVGPMFLRASVSPRYTDYSISLLAVKLNPKSKMTRTLLGPQQSFVAFFEPHMHGRMLVKKGLGLFEGMPDNDSAKHMSWVSMESQRNIENCHNYRVRNIAEKTVVVLYLFVLRFHGTSFDISTVPLY